MAPTLAVLGLFCIWSIKFFIETKIVINEIRKMSSGKIKDLKEMRVITFGISKKGRSSSEENYE